MKGKEKNQLKSQKGITLIALVITIVVLLILAGVTLSIVFNGGIINKSQQAVDTYSEESAREKLSLAIFDYKMGYITGGEKDLIKYIDDNKVGKVTGGEESTDTEYIIEVDGYEFIVKKENLEITSNGPVTGEKPEIQETTFELVGKEKLSAIIKVTASATKGGALTVKIGNQTATLENGTYNLTVTNNGTYTILVEESGLTRKAIRTVEVSGIEKVVLDNINGNANTKVGSGDFAYNNPVVPVGFRTSSDGASWADANNDGIIDGWNDGLVITDAENDGNEFVWVPVDGTNVTYDRKLFAKNYTDITNAGISSLSDDASAIPVNDETYQINTYGGFYIARYEAGKPSSGTVPLSKYNQTVWNNIDYNDANTYAKSYKTNNSFVLSGLVTGRMRDALMKWIAVTDGLNVLQNDSSSWGIYIEDGLKNTGVGILNKNIRKKNIYDLAGNVWEWTAEKFSSSNRVYNGGSYGDRRFRLSSNMPLQ